MERLDAKLGSAAHLAGAVRAKLARPLSRFDLGPLFAEKSYK